MLMEHYVKRCLESLFVHRFGLSTMPSYMIVLGILYYWVLAGLIVGMCIFSENYAVPKTGGWIASCVTFLLFAFAEYMNGCCHCVLRDLRAPGTATRGIPHVSCVITRN